MRLIFALGVAASAVAFTVWLIFFQAPQLSDAQLEEAGRACAQWISEDYADGRATTVGEHWTKKQKHVFEIYARKRDSESRQILLCVYDVENGRMLKPSALDQSWR